MRTIRFWGPCRREREKIKNLRVVLRDLVDAVVSSGAAEAVNSNDLGEAMDEAEKALRR